MVVPSAILLLKPFISKIFFLFMITYLMLLLIIIYVLPCFRIYKNMNFLLEHAGITSVMLLKLLLRYLRK